MSFKVLPQESTIVLNCKNYAAEYPWFEFGQIIASIEIKTHFFSFIVTHSNNRLLLCQYVFHFTWSLDPLWILMVPRCILCAELTFQKMQGLTQAKTRHFIVNFSVVLSYLSGHISKHLTYHEILNASSDWLKSDKIAKFKSDELASLAVFVLVKNASIKHLMLMLMQLEISWKLIHYLLIWIRYIKP